MARDLAEIVVEADLATREVVRGAARYAEREKVPLVVALIRDSGVDEVALVGAVRKHVRLSLIEPARVEPDSDAMRRLERAVCRRLRVMPLALFVAGNGRTRLKVAMADPTDVVAITEVEELSGCEVEAQLATLSAVEELIEKHYRNVVTEVMKKRPARSTEVDPPRGRGKGRRFGEGLDVKTTPHHREIDQTPATIPFH